MCAVPISEARVTAVVEAAHAVTRTAEDDGHLGPWAPGHRRAQRVTCLVGAYSTCMGAWDLGMRHASLMGFLFRSELRPRCPQYGPTRLRVVALKLKLRGLIHCRFGFRRSGAQAFRRAGVQACRLQASARTCCVFLMS